VISKISLIEWGHCLFEEERCEERQSEVGWIVFEKYERERNLIKV
jgi:hypothetical protein